MKEKYGNILLTLFTVVMVVYGGIQVIVDVSWIHPTWTYVSYLFLIGLTLAVIKSVPSFDKRINILVIVIVIAGFLVVEDWIAAFACAAVVIASKKRLDFTKGLVVFILSLITIAIAVMLTVSLDLEMGERRKVDISPEGTYRVEQWNMVTNGIKYKRVVIHRELLGIIDVHYKESWGDNYYKIEWLDEDTFLKGDQAIIDIWF